jgi:DNA-binding IclR family transcriptional regulator
MGILEKSAQALQIVAAHGSITPKELAKAMRISKSAAYRLVLSLTEVRFLDRLSSGEGFALGPLVRDLAGGIALGEQLYQKAARYMANLRDRCGETVGLHTIHGGRRMLLGQQVSHHEHRWVYSNVKVPMPLHAGAASKMLLAEMPREEAEAVLSSEGLAILTANTPRHRGRLLKELGRIAADGYALSKEEVTPGVSSIAVPVELCLPDHPSPVVLSVTGPSQRLTEEALTATLPQMRSTANAIGAELSSKARYMREIA